MLKIGLAVILAGVVVMALVLAGCTRSEPVASAEGQAASATTEGKIVKTEEEWRASLTDEQYQIVREKGTERAFTGKYWDCKDEGVYACVACGNELFSSETKYKSGTGWPSFWAPVAEGAVATEEDRSLFSVRTEVLCSRCDAHLGHVFDDGPKPTGKRFCMNSAALDLKPAKPE